MKNNTTQLIIIIKDSASWEWEWLKITCYKIKNINQYKSQSSDGREKIYKGIFNKYLIIIFWVETLIKAFKHLF